jgi:hypothetical protein
MLDSVALLSNNSKTSYFVVFRREVYSILFHILLGEEVKNDFLLVVTEGSHNHLKLFHSLLY